MSPELKTDQNVRLSENQSGIEIIEKPIKQPIPIKNRMSHFALTHIKPTEERSLIGIARKTGVRSVLVSAIANSFGIEPTHGVNSQSIDPSQVIYPLMTLELVREEIKWIQAFSKLDPFVSRNQIANFMGKTKDWVKTEVEKLEINPADTILKNGTTKYPRIIVRTLRDVILSTPLDDGWYILEDIESITKRNPDWIKDRISELGFIGEPRQSTKTGRIYKYYSPQQVDAIINISDHSVKAGDWLTLNSLSLQVPKSWEWIEKRLIDNYASVREAREDDHGVVRAYYPPYVLQELLQQAEVVANYPEAGDYLTIVKIAKQVGHDFDWVINRLDFVSAKPETRMAGNKRESVHYPSSVVDELLSLDSNILLRNQPENEGWLTAKSIQVLLNKDKKWVKKRLAFYIDQSKPIKLHHVERTHFPPNVVEALRLEAEKSKLLSSDL